MKKRVADIIFETLAECGVDTCFAVVGGGAMYLDDALGRNEDISVYFNHHEQACSMAAEGYARLKGSPAAVCVTSGPGGINAMNGVEGAWVDSIPMIVLSGNVRKGISIPESGLKLRSRGPQEFQVVPAAKTMTKYATQLLDPLEARSEILKAFDIAMNGRRGPVWIDVPLDVQCAMVEESELVEFSSPLPVYTATTDDVERLREMLEAAERPCFLAGSGIVGSGSLSEFIEFVETNNIPIVGQTQVADILANTNEKFFGLSGTSGPRAGNFILNNADLIVTLADSLSFRQTGFDQSLFAPNATFVMVDVDDDEVKKPGLNISTYIKSDIKEFFKKWKTEGVSVSASDEWMDYCQRVYAAFDPFEGGAGHSDGERVSQYRFWKEYDRLAPDNAVVALGNNTAICAKLQVGKRTNAQRVIANYASGSMGYDLPAAIGACIASGREVVCATGDGSIMMNLQELQTIRQYNLPVKVVVFSNDGYGTMRQTCKNFFGGKYIGCTEETGVSFPKFEDVAKTFGMKFMRCENNGQIANCLDRFFAEDGSVLLVMDELLVDPLIPKLMSRQDEDGNFVSPSLTDLYPFVDKELRDSFML